MHTFRLFPPLVTVSLFAAFAGCGAFTLPTSGGCSNPTPNSCGGTCVSLQNDPLHCGSCSHACAAGQVCSNGSCGATCSSPTTLCGSGADARCVDLQTDSANCGACGSVCTNSAGCMEGACPITFADSGSVGSWAHRFLAAGPYSKLRIVVDYAPGEQPTQSALDTLSQKLSARLNKPGGIQVVIGKQLNTGGRTVYSAADSVAVEQANRLEFASGDTAVMYIAYVNGHSDQDNSNGAVLAWAYDGTAVAVFKDTIDSNASFLVPASEIEGAVLVHEVGHLLGLVDTGSPMVTPHEDVDADAGTGHPGHCTVQDCVMYWALDTSNVIQLVGNLGHLPTDYDSNCAADLKANGGK